MTNILEVRHLCVKVGGNEILHDLDLSIPEGQVHALLGPNARGKTTLMMAIMGYPEYEITKGQVFFDGEDITELDIAKRAKLGISFSQ